MTYASYKKSMSMNYEQISYIELLKYHQEVINGNWMMQEFYLRNKGKTALKPKKWHEAPAECHFLGWGDVLPEFLK